ncbi:hypothetical protein OPIT5_06430 [Opitutaceae bacterium TAV5]|nr:hypothetical protein OPIT5_06430 [Opitutaceae bacterium TAV5]
MQPNNDLVPLLIKNNCTPLARLRTRSAREISDSPWSIGCEVLDRDYADFSQSGPHLGELGAKYVRLQCGWAKCEPAPTGDYHWGWLDDVVDACLAASVQPWLQTSYGNPAYPGGGGIGLSEGLPTSPEALAAWDRWVRALVMRYGDRVNTWEVWNEPESCQRTTPADYATFFIRTAKVIRDAQPGAHIVGFATYILEKKTYALDGLRIIVDARAADLLNEISIHSYPHNPDDLIDLADEFACAVAHMAPHIKIRQGECGAPSACVPIMALSGHFWNERKQAAWNLRSLLVHHAHGYPMSLYQLSDMYYEKRAGALHEGWNPKGLLCLRPDKTVAYRKPSYFAAQHVYSLLDNTWPLRRLEPLERQYPTRSTAFAWTRKNDTSPALVSWWRADAPPECVPGDLKIDPICITAPAVLSNPVLVDFVSGIVFTPPAGAGRDTAGSWSNLPCADSPLALAERDVLPLREL